jgi:transposase
MADWLVACGVTTVAMQSTSVYGVGIHDILSERGIAVFVVNARDTKNLPGRKTDIQECQWLLKLHTFGLLKNSFRPDEEFVVMRAYWRQRQQLVEDAARSIQHMQKALTQMNLQLANVISDISGTTGQAILSAILSGERDPLKLAKLRDPHIRASESTVAKSLEGNWRPELLFLLRQAMQTYQNFQQQIGECDKQLELHYRTMESKGDVAKLAPVERNKRPRGNAPVSFDQRSELYRVSGVDLTGITGINVVTAQTILAEVGMDMSRFPNEANFVSYLDLSPRNKISGGKIVGREKRKTKSRAGQALRFAAGSLLRSETYLGAQYRRLRTKLGAPKARKAMGNKLARIVYRMLKFGETYVEKGMNYYETKHREIQVRMLAKKAKELGLELKQTA